MIKKLYTKKEIFLLLIFVLLISLFLSSLFLNGWKASWYFVYVPSAEPIFADMRFIQGALKSESLGSNPYINNPGDPWGRALNYPPIWIDIAKIFNLENENFFLMFNLTMVSIYLLICLILLLKVKSFLFLFIIFSSSSLLGIERGNSDLIIFSIIYFSLYLLPLYSFFFISLASFLKIYPLALILTFLENKKILFSFAIIGIFTIYLNIEELKYIILNTPKSAGLSYGSSTISKGFSKLLGINIKDYFISVILVLLIISFYLMFKDRIKTNFEKIDEKIITSFLYGGLIYVGTFLLSKNFDYRLIFLILCYEFIFLININKLRIFLIFCMIISFNYALLISVFGVTLGALLCLIAKVFLLIFISYYIIMILKVRSPFINKFLNYLHN